MIDWIFRLIEWGYKTCFILTLWLGIFTAHKSFMNLMVKYEYSTGKQDVIYWVTFIGLVYFGYFLASLIDDRDKAKRKEYEEPKKRSNFSSLGKLDDRFGEAVDPKNY